MPKENSAIFTALIITIVVSILPSNPLTESPSWHPDWTWIILAIISLVLVKLSENNKRVSISQFLTIFTLIPLISQIFLGIICLFVSNTFFWVLSLILQTWVATAFGYICAMVLNAHTDILISERWMLLFSLLFAMIVSGIYMFLKFISLYTLGYPVFNHELQGSAFYEERMEVNTLMMLPPAVATFASVVFALVLRRWVKKTELSHRAEVRADE